MRKLFILILLPAAIVSYGQGNGAHINRLIPKQLLMKDLAFLNEAVEKGHPVNYLPSRPVSLQGIIAEANAGAADSLTAADYTLWIEKAIYEIGCVHTSVIKNPLLQSQSRQTCIPLTASRDGGILQVTGSRDSTLTGQYIFRINDTPAERIVARYSRYKASDGATDAFAKEYFHFVSPRLIAAALSFPDSFRIETDKGVSLLGAIPGFYTRKPGAVTGKPALKHGNNYFLGEDSIPVLRLRSFGKGDRRFYASVFRKLSARHDSGLVIDLRQNTGGSRKAAIGLMKYLSDTVFSYRIVQPRLTPGRYLTGKGKFYLLLSRLKYNVGSFYKAHQTREGRSFKYTYKPRRTGHFGGQITVLTDGFTASSATMVTSWLAQHSRVSFTGEQAAGGYNGNNGGSFPAIRLPGSGIEIRFPVYRIVLDENSSLRAGIIPGADSLLPETMNR